MAREIHKEFVMVGFADLYTAPGDTTAPLDTIGMGEATTPWVSIGATEEGVTTTFGRETTDHFIEEDPLPALTTLASATFNLGFALAEDTLESLRLAYGGTITPGVAPAPSRLELSAAIETLAVLFESPLPDGGFRRIYIPRLNRTGEVETAYRRSEQKHIFPVTLASVCALEDIDIADFPPDGTLLAAPADAEGDGQQQGTPEQGQQAAPQSGQAQPQQGAQQRSRRKAAA